MIEVTFKVVDRDTLVWREIERMMNDPEICARVQRELDNSIREFEATLSNHRWDVDYRRY